MLISRKQGTAPPTASFAIADTDFAFSDIIPKPPNFVIIITDDMGK